MPKLCCQRSAHPCWACSSPSTILLAWMCWQIVWSTMPGMLTSATSSAMSCMWYAQQQNRSCRYVYPSQLLLVVHDIHPVASSVKAIKDREHEPAAKMDVVVLLKAPGLQRRKLQACSNTGKVASGLGRLSYPDRICMQLLFLDYECVWWPCVLSVLCITGSFSPGNLSVTACKCCWSRCGSLCEKCHRTLTFCMGSIHLPASTLLI